MSFNLQPSPSSNNSVHSPTTPSRNPKKPSSNKPSKPPVPFWTSLSFSSLNPNINSNVGFVPPPFNPNIVQELEAEARGRRETNQAEALTWNQPTVNLGTLSESLAAAAGKKLEDLSDADRSILQTIESDQANRYTQGASLGAG
jgi:hypothetical protein